MINVGAPETLELAEIQAWGCPFHGLVTAGSLELPNAATLAWPQPAFEDYLTGTVPLYWHGVEQANPFVYARGFTLTVPGVAAAPAAITAETAAGWEWKDYLILSGARHLVYKTHLVDSGEPAWVAAWGPADVWMLKPAATHALTLVPGTSDSLALAFTARRFGRLNYGDDSIVNITLSLAPSGLQATAPADPDFGTASVRLNALDYSGNGQKALFLVSGLYSGFARPAAIIEVDFSAWPGAAATASVVADIDDFLGRGPQIVSKTYSDQVLDEFGAPTNCWNIRTTLTEGDIQCTLTAWYKADDTVALVTGRHEYSNTIVDAPAASTYEGDETYTIQVDGSTAHTFTIAQTTGGVVTGSGWPVSINETVSYSGSYSGPWCGDPPYPGGGGTVYNVGRDMNPAWFAIGFGHIAIFQYWWPGIAMTGSIPDQHALGWTLSRAGETSGYGAENNNVARYAAFTPETRACEWSTSQIGYV